MEKKWLEREVDDEVAGKLASDLNIILPLATLLAQRGVTSFDGAKRFFRPSLDMLHDPFLMKDMDRAVNRISDAISGGEKILVYGDYDVDGTTSVALVYSFLKKFTSRVQFYVPDRYTEGYGISKKGIEWAAAQDISLIIALDCGIKAFDNARLTRELRIDLIICDHHLPGETLPNAYAILDPKRSDCQYPFKELSGCGVGFKLMSGFCVQNTIDLNELYAFLDLVTVSIASDIVPIVDENRTLAFFGLRKLNHAPQPGLGALIEIAGIKPPIDISDIVFYIGPRINATGRLTHAKESVNLLIADGTDKSLDEYTKNLQHRNVERRAFDASITQEALEMIQASDHLLKAKSTVLYNENWHKGVIGIVASRCTEHFYRPTIILTRSNGLATGSARSVDGFDVFEAISACSDLLEQYGGHTHAAGLSLKLKNLPAFIDRFEEVVSSTITADQLIPKLPIDQRVTFDLINFKTNSILSQMAPFGPGNPKPVFSAEKVYLKYPPQLIKEEHIKLVLHQKDHKMSYPAIGFGMAKMFEGISQQEPLRIAFHLEENNYQGNKSLQLILKDVKFYD